MDSAAASLNTAGRRPPIDFDACPVCRGTLEDSMLLGAAPRCPHCDTDLSPYLNLLSRAGELLELAARMLERGDDDLAEEVVARLPQLLPDPGPQYWELAARLAISRRQWDSARALAGRLSPELRGEIERLTALVERNRRSARELFNYALTCARRGEYRVASDSLAAAADYDPDNADIWRLKLKVDLKAGRWQQCYSDLAGLDRLAARPQEFAGIEKLLPAV
ncbi:hypothetical protein IT575_12310 [bacterium]|nr:hypothetical protein [bacterium]